MNLAHNLPQREHILALAERVSKKYPNPHGMCEFMTNDLIDALRQANIRCDHVMGVFYLDEPGAFEYISPEDEEGADEYEVHHDWVSVEGKILDISARQFRKYVHQTIPDIVFAGFREPLFNYYKALGYGD
jgi:hypothetical protein